MRALTELSVWELQAQNKPYHLAISAQGTESSKWVASLSCGLTVFDNGRIDDQPSWLRLKQFCVDHNIKITQLRLQHNGQTINTRYNADGYFFSKRMAKWLNPPFVGDPNIYSVGVGYLEDGIIHINWITPHGVIYEERNLSKLHDKHKSQPGLIRFA